MQVVLAQRVELRFDASLDPLHLLLRLLEVFLQSGSAHFCTLHSLLECAGAPRRTTLRLRRIGEDRRARLGRATPTSSCCSSTQRRLSWGALPRSSSSSREVSYRRRRSQALGHGATPLSMTNGLRTRCAAALIHAFALLFIDRHPLPAAATLRKGPPGGDRCPRLPRPRAQAGLRGGCPANPLKLCHVPAVMLARRRSVAVSVRS